MKTNITKEQSEMEAFALLGYGCALVMVQTIMIFIFLILTDFDWFTKWLFIFPSFVYIISTITFTIKMIQIELRF